MPRALILAAVLLFAGGGAAHAEQAMVVKVRGLALHTEAGASVAVQRMYDAAKVFCTPRGRDGVRDYDVTTLKCRSDMVRRATAQLNQPKVEAVRTRTPGVLLAAAP